jgi:DNA repair protein RAD7
MASLNPGVENLRLDFCGRIDDSAMNHWSKRLPALTRLELYGPFLVRTEGWLSFFESHPQLTGFLITQSPRFDLACMESLARNCKGLTELRLAEIGKMGDEFLPYVASFKDLQSLDLSSPGGPVSSDALVELLSKVGPKLNHLNLSNMELLDDAFIENGLLPHTHALSTLILEGLPEITDGAIANFFQNTTNPPLTKISFRRCHQLADEALQALVAHSSEELIDLNINGWKSASDEALKEIAKLTHLKELDIGWCRQVDDFVVKDILEGCKEVTNISCFGCNKLTLDCPRRVRVVLYLLRVSDELIWFLNP